MGKNSKRRVNAELLKLAGLYKIQTSYRDVFHKTHHSSLNSLIAALKSLGAIKSMKDVKPALIEKEQKNLRIPVEPVIVCWDGKPKSMEICLPKSHDNKVSFSLKLENGGSKHWALSANSKPSKRIKANDGIYLREKTRLPGMPLGYHRLISTINGRPFKTFIIAAPSKAYVSNNKKAWGFFSPLYSIRSDRNWGCGDFTDLEALIDKINGFNGNIVATLPFLAAFLDKPFDPSPYAPASRLFWNEIFVDIEKIAELKECSEARKILNSKSFKANIDSLRGEDYLDYRRLAKLKRRVMERLAAHFFSIKGGYRKNQFLHFLKTKPLATDYARFRALCELQKKPWKEWPSRLKRKKIRGNDFDKKVMQYHLYAQFIANEQVQSLAKKAEDIGFGFYLDTPLGVHPNSFDVWHNQGIFILNVSVGAPPDTVFTLGQNWGFPPMHPEKIRENCYTHFIEYIRHQLKFADFLRIDHVMGLHRLYWIPDGLSADEGIYVHYNAEELYAILCIESHKCRCQIVGENLGTVPKYVNQAMSKHNILKMYVIQYELNPNSKRILKEVYKNSVVGLNTHDMPTFVGYWNGIDLKERVKLGLLSKEDARLEYNLRQKIKKSLIEFLREHGFLNSPDIFSVLEACIAYLCTSKATVVLPSMDDLWLETRPHNMPGTQRNSNWALRSKYSLDQFFNNKRIQRLMSKLNNCRATSCFKP